MKTLYKILMITISSILLLSGFYTNAFAAPQDNPRNHNPENHNNEAPCSSPFSVHDIDRDGSLSRQEYQQFVEQIEKKRIATGRPMRRFSPPLLFEEIDSDNDEFLTEDELISALNMRLRKHRHYRYRQKSSER